jgi:centromeric protein E
VQDVFAYIRQTPEREFLLRVSYFEIYNEVINDLLDPSGTNLSIREDKRKGVYVEGLKEEIVMSPEQVMSVLAAGEAHRHVGATDFNAVSSRSHTIFRLVAESKLRPADDAAPSPSQAAVRVSSLALIDLAGSEKASAHSASDKALRRMEGSYINKSLLTLGNVISKLSSLDKKKR